MMEDKYTNTVQVEELLRKSLPILWADRARRSDPNRPSVSEPELGPVASESETDSKLKIKNGKYI